MEYKLYKPNAEWKISQVVKLLFVGSIFTYIFYDAWFGIIFTIPFMPIVWMQEKKTFVDKRKRMIKENFKDFIVLLSGSLGAGYSLENSFCQALGEYEKTSCGDSLILEELKIIVNGIGCNKRLEDMLLDFGTKSQVKEIEDFAELIVTAKIYGGNLIKLIRQTTSNYKENCLVEMEIETMISAKKLEAKIMLIAPILIVLYMRLTDGGYMDVLYNTGMGRMVMTVCMSALVVAWLIIDKIMKIEV